MNTKVVKDKVESWGRIVFSITLLIFHGTVFGAILIVMLIVNYLTKGGT